MSSFAEIKFPSNVDWRSWIERWDRMQDRYLVRRKERFELMVQLVEDTQGEVSCVLDIGCGTGSLMLQILERFSRAEVYGIGFDPTLLALADKRLEKFSKRVKLIQADLRDKSWSKLVSIPMEAAVSATTLHWLKPEQIVQFYGQLTCILQPGGIFLNADHVCSNCESIQKSWEQHREQMLRQQVDCDADDWDGFWDAYGRALKIDIEGIRKRLMGPWEGSEEGLSLEWHFEKLKASGFESVDCFWRCDCDAIYGGVRGQV